MAATGKIIQITGPVVDVQFPSEDLPEIAAWSVAKPVGPSVSTARSDRGRLLIRPRTSLRRSS